MVESFGAFVAITLTMLFASTHGPSGDRPISIRDSNAFASLVNLTEGRACNPTSCRISTDARTLFMALALASDRRQFFCGPTHGLNARSRSRFGRRHHFPFDHRRAANRNAYPTRFGQQLDRHPAVGL